jgi:hypothetical protein
MRSYMTTGDFASSVGQNPPPLRLLKTPRTRSLRAEMGRRQVGHRSAAISKSLWQSHPRSPRYDRETRSRLAMTVVRVFQQAPLRRGASAIGGRTSPRRAGAKGFCPTFLILVLDVVLFICFVGICPDCFARTYLGFVTAHNQGNIQTPIVPGGWTVFNLLALPIDSLIVDPITNDTIPGTVYPRGTRNVYMDGLIEILGLSGDDTLSSSFQTWPNPLVFDSSWEIRSSDVSSSYYSPEARSDLDIECTYYDTAIIPWQAWDPRPHVPLGIRITQRSMAWSGKAVDDFILLHYEVTNVGVRPLTSAYATVGSFGRPLGARVDDVDNLTGYLRNYFFEDRCEYRHTLNLAYNMDNDGDPVDGKFTWASPRAAVGVMLLGSVPEVNTPGYNWYIWASDYTRDWGPRRLPTVEEPWRSFDPFFAMAHTTEEIYYTSSLPYVAYDQMFSAIYHTSEGWLSPTDLSLYAAMGSAPCVNYSFGPFDIPVRDKISFTIAVVGGDNVHTNPAAFFDPYNPQPFYDQLDFSELAENARCAQWVYDNPGVDTDSDGYAGEYRVCEGDTIWYKGDGVPDFRGNSPPPIPFTRYETEPGRIIVRWNGFLSETTRDIFSRLIDFEGYRVYCGLDNRRTSLSLLTTYDKENWFRLKYHQLGGGQSRWVNDDPPYSLDSLRIIHDDPDFDPARYPRERPLIESDSAFYFQPVDANRADLSSMTGIHKAYPQATNPGTDSSLWTEEDITTEHGRSLPKYYEYEYFIDNLLPTVPYFVSVTVFDFGYSGGRGNMAPDETNPLSNCTEVYAQTSSEIVEQQDLDVYVYPNPYRADADYHEHGYENRKGTIIPDRARLIHFSNLPRVCKISIFSLDGDLIGTIDHSFPEGGPESMHDWWNLVNRSGLAVESGLYYWVVESPARTQIGKLVILK